MKQFQGALAFPEAEGNLFIKYSFALCQLHLELGHHFKDEDLPLFPSLPKMHMLLHACKLCKIINPRLVFEWRTCRKSAGILLLLRLEASKDQRSV